jgi:Vam6/Vps39-like protein vacuolar protein sorting-associated protein 39
LHAVSLFHSGKFDEAINVFIELDINPAKVVALYPQSVGGRLSVPQDRWIPLFGGPSVIEEMPSNDSSKEASRERHITELEHLQVSPTGTARAMLKGLGSFIHHDDDTASISSKRGRKKKSGLHGAFETPRIE